MARFPKSESEIVALAQTMIAGFKANPDLYPTPPVDMVEIEAKLQTYLQSRNEANAAQAAAQQSIEVKNHALQNLMDDMKSDIRYAENTVKSDDAKLKLIGWGGRKAATAQKPPGQCRSLEAPRQGEGWVFLDWKEPADGGNVLAYKIQWREQGTETWQEAGMALESEITLVNQMRGQSLEYRAIALNKAGAGDPSNTVTVVL